GAPPPAARSTPPPHRRSSTATAQTARRIVPAAVPPLPGPPDPDPLRSRGHPRPRRGSPHCVRRRPAYRRSTIRPVRDVDTRAPPAASPAHDGPLRPCRLPEDLWREPLELLRSLP